MSLAGCWGLVVVAAAHVCCCWPVCLTWSMPLLPVLFVVAVAVARNCSLGVLRCKKSTRRDLNWRCWSFFCCWRWCCCRCCSLALLTAVSCLVLQSSQCCCRCRLWYFLVSRLPFLLLLLLLVVVVAVVGVAVSGAGVYVVVVQLSWLLFAAGGCRCSSPWCCYCCCSCLRVGNCRCWRRRSGFCICLRRRARNH